MLRSRRTTTPPAPPEAPSPQRGSERGAGRRPGASWWIKLPAALVVLILAVVLAGRLDLLPKLQNPFGTETEDRTGPTLLQSIKDMSRYQAATGNFQVVVDLDKDAKFLPDAVRGSRTLFVGAGEVGAYVDLGGLGKRSVSMSDDRRSATVRLPHAELGKPALDSDRSYAVTEERGLLDRLGDVFSDNPGDEREVHKVAVQHIGEAAKKSDLPARAEKNTRSMLENLLKSLGFDRITIDFPKSR
ncbi:DUF4230 domain-containing protein [Streptomyces sp. H27-D2]|nr:DUF4230 domain-containing protein [Streptomyces sp. H27-D2]MEC4016139.1 DUF4230 domain-containing protein [Streptomyces sp. H27-D2]